MDRPSQVAGGVVDRGRYHPLRWRRLTWFIVAVDAFAVAFLVGIAIGVGRVSPLGTDAEEGVAMLVFLAAAFALVLNVALGLIWIIAAVVARRRRPGGEPVRRWIWVPAPVALVAGAFIGVQLITGSYAGERILSAGSLRTWIRVSNDESIFGGEGNQIMNDVVLGGPGFVAVGSDGLAGGEDAAVWTSSDRMTWSRVPDQTAFGGTGSQVMTGVLAAGPGLVAVGYDAAQGDDDAAVWVSADGITWSRVPHDEGVLGGEGNQTMRDITRAVTLVAVGSDGTEGAEHAAVWTSADGISWSRIPDDEAVFGGSGPLFMESVDVGGPWVVAVGHTTSWARGDPAPIWMSRDGFTWTREPDGEAAFGGTSLSGVAVGGPGLVAVGHVGEDAAVWTASPPDDIPWSRLPHDELVFGGEGKQFMSDVMVAGTTLIAVGGGSWPVSPVAAVWTSATGITRSRVPDVASMSGGLMNGVAGDGRGLVAVGLLVGDGDPDAAVWVTTDVA